MEINPVNFQNQLNPDIKAEARIVHVEPFALLLECRIRSYNLARIAAASSAISSWLISTLAAPVNFISAIEFNGIR